jgi:hypothetical protein
MGEAGLEPAASCVSDKRSPVELLALEVDREGVEPSNHRLNCRIYHYGAAA